MTTPAPRRRISTGRLVALLGLLCLLAGLSGVFGGMAHAQSRALSPEAQQALETMIESRTEAAARAAESGTTETAAPGDSAVGASEASGASGSEAERAAGSPADGAAAAPAPTTAAPPSASVPDNVAGLLAALRNPETRAALVDLLRATEPGVASPSGSQGEGASASSGSPPASSSGSASSSSAGLSGLAAAAVGSATPEAPAGAGESAPASGATDSSGDGGEGESVLPIPAPDITALTNLFHDLYEDVVWTSGITTQVPEIWNWIRLQFDDTQRDVWLHLSWQIALVVLAGVVTAVLIRFMLIGAIRRLQEKAAETSGTRRLILLVTRLVLSLLPIGVFAVTAQATMPVIDATWRTELVAAVVVTTMVILRAVDLVLGALLSPGDASLRLMPASDETATILTRGLRRIGMALVLGYLLVEVSRLLGMPHGGRMLLVHLAGLVVLVLSIRTLIALRAIVKAHIRRINVRGGASSAWIGGLLRGLADIWHILATAYAIGIFFAWVVDTERWFALAGLATLKTVVVFFLGLVVFGWVQKVRDASMMRLHGAGRLDRGARERGRRYIGLTTSAVRVLVGLIALALILDAWHLGALSWLLDGGGKRFVTMALNLALVLAVAVALWEGVNHMILRYLSSTDAQGKLVERGQRERTLLPLLRNVLTVFLVVVASLIVLSEIGVDIAPLLAGAGVIGLAIGFGSQKLVQDVISGVFNLLEDTIGVGDVVQVGSHAGVVEAMSIRSIRLRDLSGNLHTIPFSGVDTVTNMTKDFSYYLLEVGIAYRENTDYVTSILHEIGAELQADDEYGPSILEPLEVLGVDGFKDSAVIIKARIMTKPIMQWWVGREFNRRMKHRFDALGIEIPFPHTTLYFGVDKEGNAPPAHLHVDRLAAMGRHATGSGGHPVESDPTVEPPPTPKPVHLPDPDGDGPGEGR
ncbi:mechanosensitive ion channel domain-containing protein [Roseospira marina]|uniref:mechanosensitive ion channel domain-containing protein n=1 Tax=Roseospira marina TaxID=140057 RepID=UPI0016109193|nr:mechanosensitive ion channel domain-containing protein [Roseospira marina]MBB4312835.1 small conductance mechanosensitive channel [Roseospira marina]MBB5086392.1 small conductance mechanosensitive channel [Roseospira marina]